MTDESIMTPIGEPRASRKSEPADAPRKAKRSFARDIDGLIWGLAALSAIITFGLAVYFFYGFTQTDQGLWTLASAFGLCFGVGALAYVPCAILAVIARRARLGRASRKMFALALLLMLPWVCTALVFIGSSALPTVYGFTALLLSVSFCIWAFSRLRRQPKI